MLPQKSLQCKLTYENCLATVTSDVNEVCMMGPHSNVPPISASNPSQSEMDKWKEESEKWRREYAQSEFVGGSTSLYDRSLASQTASSP